MKEYARGRPHPLPMAAIWTKCCICGSVKIEGPPPVSSWQIATHCYVSFSATTKPMRTLRLNHGRFYKGVPIQQTPGLKGQHMKSSAVERAIGGILKDGLIVNHLSGELSEKEVRRVVMFIANFAARAGKEPLMHEALKLLGFRDQEILIFVSACLHHKSVYMVPSMVEQFCRETALARRELAIAAGILIKCSMEFRLIDPLVKAVRCVGLMHEQISRYAKGDNWDNGATKVTCRIVGVLSHTFGSPFTGEAKDRVVVPLRFLVKSDEDWEWILEHKITSDCPA